MAAVQQAHRAGVLALGLLAGTALVPPAFAQAQPQSLSQSQPQVNAPNFADLVARVAPAVVRVTIVGHTEAQQAAEIPPELRGTPFEDFFRRFGGQGGPSQRRIMGQGSGFIIDPDGYVVTNNHVVDNGSEVQIVTDDGRTLDAKVIGTDAKTDLALLKAEGSDFPYVKLAPQKARIGDWVLAVGNPFGLGGTVTAGIVSAQNRDIGQGPYDDFLQIDAPINRGNSGGPTFNLAGEVVGVNTAIFSPSGGNVGIAFAIPASTVDQVVNSLKENGSVTRGFIGVQMQPVTKEIAEAIGLKEPKGALVAEALKDSPAAKAGIRTGDTIVAVDGEAIKEAKDLSRRIANVAPGKSVQVTLYREGKERTVSVEVAKQPKA
jgi:serine protease Do